MPIADPASPPRLCGAFQPGEASVAKTGCRIGEGTLGEPAARRGSVVAPSYAGQADFLRRSQRASVVALLRSYAGQDGGQAALPLHCYPSISRILAKIFSAASTQRRKDAKTQRGKCMVIWSFGSESLRLSVFALNSLGCGSPHWGICA